MPGQASFRRLTPPTRLRYTERRHGRRPLGLKAPGGTKMDVRSRKNIIPPAFLVVLGLIFAISPGPALAQARTAAAPALSITVSMERPTAHYYHVVFRADGLKGEIQDFKMPAWTPGYYRIMDYAKNVKDFQAVDGAGRPLAWEKTAKNIWRVRSGKAASIIASYDVYAFTRFLADRYLRH